MISDVNDVLLSWVNEVLQAWAKPPVGEKPSYGLPPDPEGETTVHLYLMELSDDERRRSSGRPLVQPSLRYLVTVSGQNTLEAQELLANLLFAALDDPDLEVEFEPAHSPLWSALHIRPRPAFILRMPLPREMPPVKAYRVTQVTVDASHAVGILFGQLVGPGGIPLAQARVELEKLNRTAYTDHQGHFSITGVPGETLGKTLLVSALGYTQESETFNEIGTAEQPLCFVMTIPELDIPDRPPASQKTATLIRCQ